MFRGNTGRNGYGGVTGAAVLDPYSTSAAAQKAAKRAMAQRHWGLKANEGLQRD